MSTFNFIIIKPRAFDNSAVCKYTLRGKINFQNYQIVLRFVNGEKDI